MNSQSAKSSPDRKMRFNPSERREKTTPNKAKAPTCHDSDDDTRNTNDPSSPAAATSSTSTTKVARAPPLCRFFVLHGNCRYGDDCNFSHTLPAGGIVEARKQIPCRFYLQGCCRYGDHCQLRHDDPNDATSEAAYTCGICLEPIGLEYNKRFGLLEGCDHVYCMECVMTWRSEGSSEAHDRRVCPTCRKKSNYVIPSWEYCVGDDKEQVIEKYKAKLAKMPCKRFNGDYGSCPFGRSCFYAHMRGDRNVKSLDKTMEEIQQTRENRRRRAWARNQEDIEIISNFLLFLELMVLSDDSDDDDDLETLE